MSLFEKAAFYHSGVAHGIVAPRDAIAWADALIAAEESVPTELYDVSLAPPERPSALLEALRHLAPLDAASESAILALLDVLRERHRSGELSAAKAVAAAYSITRPLGYDSRIHVDALLFYEDYSLAADGIVGTVGQRDAEVQVWLEQFAGAAASFLPRAG